MPHPSVICVELHRGSRQPTTGRLATRPGNATVMIHIDTATPPEKDRATVTGNMQSPEIYARTDTNTETLITILCSPKGAK